jgi:hypothetical protein
MMEKRTAEQQNIECPTAEGWHSGDGAGTNIDCTMCGNRLHNHEVNDPRTNDEGNLVCDDCYREHYTFECCLCGEDDETTHQHNMVVVFDDQAGVPVGTYRVTGCPYYSCSILGDGEILPFRVERIGDVPNGAESDGYWCGHLCRECQAKYGNQRTASENGKEGYPGCPG